LEGGKGIDANTTATDIKVWRIRSQFWTYIHTTCNYSFSTSLQQEWLKQ